MICHDAEPLLSATLDGELDAKTSLDVEQHMAGCALCHAQYRKFVELREEIALSELDWGMNMDLRPLQASIRRRIRPSSRFREWMNLPLLATAAAALFLVIVVPGRFPSAETQKERQVVDNHVRSLMAGHLIDMPSSDRHTVKPWFQGKLPFAPSVPDLTAEGFTLIGGRLDVITGKPAAAIVYTRRNHVINLLVASGDGRDSNPAPSDVNGYHLLHWHQGGFDYWAVSDVNDAELQQFVALIKAR